MARTASTLGETSSCDPRRAGSSSRRRVLIPPAESPRRQERGDDEKGSSAPRRELARHLVEADAGGAPEDGQVVEQVGALADDLVRLGPLGGEHDLGRLLPHLLA